MVGRHRRRVDLHAIRFGRWALAVLGLWSLLATVGQTDTTRYQLLPGLLIAIVLMIAGLVPNERRATMRKFVAASAAGPAVMAGVVAAISIIEAMTLLADAAVLQLLTFLFRERARACPTDLEGLGPPDC